MTKNQIEYMKLKEDARHNLAVEVETVRANKAKEGETNRANLANEGLTGLRDSRNYELGLANLQLGKDSLSESVRHNQVSETNQAYQINMQTRYNDQYIAENKRANLARENENVRHNKIVEQETQRHNEVSEQTGYLQASASQAQAGAAYANVNARYAELQSLDWYRGQQIDLNYQQLDEQNRHNVANERNDTMNALTNQTNANTNQRRVSLLEFDNYIRNQQLIETIRHNQETEASNRVANGINLFGNAFRGASLFIN